MISEAMIPLPNFFTTVTGNSCSYNKNVSNIMLALICEKRHKIINTIASPSAKFMLYNPAMKINAIKTKFPKFVSNKLTNNPGTANIITHNTTNSVIKPATKFIFLRLKTPDNPIYTIVKKINVKPLKKNLPYNSRI